MAIINQGKTLEDFETTIHRKDHTTRMMAWHSRNLTDASGSPMGSIAFGRDITARKHLEAQLTQAQKMEAVGTLASGIAHDFNNLLQAINGYAQISLLNVNKNDAIYTNLNAINQAGERASQLVQQLLLFSRRVAAERKHIELNQEIEQISKILERTIPKMIAIELHLGSRLGPVHADPVQIEQILLNLGGNAADAMPDGGKLLIETENVRLDEDYIRIHPGAEPGKYVLITISDTGQGMDKETVAHIFEPFFTTKDIGRGTGLGLASVYGIVMNHGGYITCRSKVGCGTTFKIYLPAGEEADVDLTEEIVSTPNNGGTETVLVVDDEEFIRNFASQVLESYGYTTLTASSGEEALDIYAEKSGEIDLIIMDIGMPGMGGTNCLRKIIDMDPSAKVIVASGYSIDGHVKETSDAGAAGYIAKPYKLVDLLGEVRTVLDEAHRRS
jgi:signal transduction histidine kinase/ActR/RegA family two-component response regulator